MTLKGYFVITDISGYTEYLTRSELDHANEILQSLFEAQLEVATHPFVISGFRGDAIFMYIPESNFVAPQSFVEALENLYGAFTLTLEQMQYRTTCTCRACQNMGSLDLKMCVHFGEYAIQRLGDREELLGADAIVPHRMLKNLITEKTGVRAYAVFSAAAAQALDLGTLLQPLTEHAETYEHLGPVKMYVHDLRSLWERDRQQRRKFVSKEGAWVGVEVDLPYPPSLVWDYLTVPELEARVLGLDTSERTDSMGGRMGTDARLHCAHGDAHFYARIVDWKPFEYYTMLQRAEPFGNLEYLHTRRFTPTENGTRFEGYIGKPESGATEQVREQLQQMCGIFANLKTVMDQDLAAKKILSA